MSQALLFTQIVLSLSLILLILLQAKGSGLGSFGRQAAVYQTKKGLERFVFRLTLVLVALFAILSIINLNS